MTTKRRRPQSAFLFGMFDIQQGLAVDHQYDRSPAVPRPGAPVSLRAALAPGFGDMEVVGIAAAGPATAADIDGTGSVFPGRRVGSHWEATLPGMRDGTIFHYVVRARDRAGRVWYGDGQRPVDGATVFTHRVTDRRPPAWTRDAVIYQIFVDRFADGAGPVPTPARPGAFAGGDLHGVRNAVPYLADLGIDTIWLTPVFTCTSYHGYDTTDLFSVDPRFGGDDALTALVEAAGGAGIRIVLDFVPNHLSSEHPWFVEGLDGGPRRDWFLFDTDGSYDTFFGNAGMPKVNLDHPDARRAMIDAARHWIEEFGIAGYRIDHVLGPSESFFAALANELNAGHPDAWLFGEATATPAFCRRYGGLLDGATDFLLAYAFRDFLADELHPEGFIEAEQEARAVLDYADFSWVRFFDNHDMDRALHVWGAHRHLAEAVDALLALPGVPAVFYGTEQALSHEISSRTAGLEVGRVPMRFDDPFGLVARLREAVERRRSRPVPSGGPEWAVAGDAVGWTWGDHRGRLGPVGRLGSRRPDG